MTIQQKVRMTVEDFLAWADQQPGRWELVDGEPVRMAPERARHNRVKFLVCRALDDAVARTALACEVFTDGMTIVVDGVGAYEPDAVVQCGADQDPESTVVAAPMIVVEVASPTNSKADLARKLIDYFKVPSIQHYLVIPADRQVVIHHMRDGSSIRTTIVESGMLRLEPPGIELAISAFWPPVRSR